MLHEIRNYFSLFPPNSTSNPQLQLLSVSTREEERNVALDNKAIVTVTNLPVAVPYASGNPLPDHLTSVGSNLQAVTIVFSFAIVPHETQECYVYRGHAELERLKMQAEILSETTKYLARPNTQMS